MKAGPVALVDLASVLLFAAIGRASHGEDLAPAGLATTTWPFAAGWVVGWVLVLAVRTVRARPLGLPAGILVWVPTVVLGMVLRIAGGAGVQTSFVLVATVVLGLFLLGWRGVARLVLRSRRETRARAEV